MSMFSQLPASAYVAFATSLLCALVLVITKRWHGHFSFDGAKGIQKFHTEATPRIGGVAIVLGIAAAYLVAKPERQTLLGPVILAGCPAFFFGLLEDITKQVSVLTRLIATMVSGVLGWYITGVSITSLDMPGLDALLSYSILSVLFTAFAIGGVANAINIIDGFNGLASGMAILALSGIAAIGYSVGDINLAFACLSLAAAIMGFFVLNWPFGKIFLGDGGSYFCGFALAWSAVLLVERNTVITPFAALLICVHPISEVLFSIYRRKLRSLNPGAPDRQHLHSLILRRYIRKKVSPRMRNSIAGIFLACMSLPAVLMAYLARQNALFAFVLCVIFMLMYVAIYARIVRHRWCSPIGFLLFRPQAQKFRNKV
ncbi:MAG: glycosyl transferase [Comamonadaceae bacterium PBBC2]|nr:MAG: glycosyl transferase [Comamonadaceae bacterium PBBC2]